jgi:ComF family protein
LDEAGQCALCRLGFRGFDAAYCYGCYEGALRELIHLFKYDKVRTLAPRFGEWLALALPRETAFDLVVPVPLHWLKRWQRGFNQAELLAREVARRWRAPLLRIARRKRYTAAQAGLTNAQRRKNAAGAFTVKGRLDGKHVLLVDDVLTTGATASACARALKRAGAARVTLLTLARTDRRTSVELNSLGAHA